MADVQTKATCIEGSYLTRALSPVLQGASSVDLVVLDLFNSGQLLEQLVYNSSYSQLNSKLQCNPFYKAWLKNLIK